MIQKTNQLKDKYIFTTTIGGKEGTERFYYLHKIVQQVVDRAWIQCQGLGCPLLHLLKSNSHTLKMHN